MDFSKFLGGGGAAFERTAFDTFDSKALDVVAACNLEILHAGEFCCAGEKNVLNLL